MYVDTATTRVPVPVGTIVLLPTGYSGNIVSGTGNRVLVGAYRDTIVPGTICSDANTNSNTGQSVPLLPEVVVTNIKSNSLFSIKVIPKNGSHLWAYLNQYQKRLRIRWSCGGYDYFDPCVANVKQEVFYGVTTLRGYDARRILSGGVRGLLPLTFIDQGNSLRRADKFTTQMNVLYATDHVLNLNFL